MFTPFKKNFKKDPIKDAIVWVPPKLVGPVWLFAKIGSGKTVTMLSLAQKYHDHPDRGYKVWDLYGGDRNEQYYWCFPSKEDKYWLKMKKKLRLATEGPKQYKVNLLFPMSKNLPDKLPQNEFVHSKVFTIPIKEVMNETIACTVGALAATNESLWNYAKDKLKKKEGGVELKKIMEDEGGASTLIYRSFVEPLVEHGLLESDDCEYNLDVKAEGKDRETISVLCLNYIEEEFRPFIIDYIVNQMCRLLDAGSIPNKQIGLMREISKFFRLGDQLAIPDRIKVFRVHLSDYVRYGRRGFYLFGDAQSPNETHGIVEGQDSLTFLGKLPSQTDREMATAQLKRDGHITAEQVKDISNLEPGQMMMICENQSCQKLYISLPRTMFWKEGFGDFFKIWQRADDHWFSTKEVIEKLEIKKKEAIKKIEDDIKLAKLLKEQKRQEEREKEFNQKMEEKEKEERKKFELKMKLRRIRRGESDEEEDFDDDQDDVDSEDIEDAGIKVVNIKNNNINKEEEISKDMKKEEVNEDLFPELDFKF